MPTASEEHLAGERDTALAEQHSPTQVPERLLELEVAATHARLRGRLQFFEDRRNVVLLGPPGLGETHLGIALGLQPPEPATAPTSPAPPTRSTGCKWPISKARCCTKGKLPE